MILMVDDTDHVTGKTGISPLAVDISKDGAAFVTETGNVTVTERTNGWYNIAVTTTHTNTLGDFIIRATGTDADPGERICVVVENIESDTYTDVASIVANSLGFSSGRDTLVADGTEQIVYENATPSAEWVPDALYIDLTDMAADDSITVKTYVKMKSGGSYILMDSQPYSDAQTIKGIIIQGIPNRYGYKVSLEQTAIGTYRDFDWERFNLG